VAPRQPALSRKLERRDSTVTRFLSPRSFARLCNSSYMNPEPLLLTTNAAAKRLGVSSYTLRRLRRLGRITAIHLEGRWFFRPRDIDSLALTKRERVVLEAVAAGVVN
jgi:Helix-turn-helix domain